MLHCTCRSWKPAIVTLEMVVNSESYHPNVTSKEKSPPLLKTGYRNLGYMIYYFSRPIFAEFMIVDNNCERSSIKLQNFITCVGVCVYSIVGVSTLASPTLVVITDDDRHEHCPTCWLEAGFQSILCSTPISLQACRR